MYYTDVIAALRDQFINNDAQTPFFVSQYTGREQFADDARKLDKLRVALGQRDSATANALTITDTSTLNPPTLFDILRQAETKLVTSDLMNTFVTTFFDDLKAKLAKSELAEFFGIDLSEYDDFHEPTANRFIIETLSHEKRPDNFVTAEISRKNRTANRFLLGSQALLSALYDDEQYVAQYDLTLNCKMSRAQLCATLTPTFSTLQRIVLVVTCAPSLETCYVFESVTQHKLYDFKKYDVDGSKAVQRWYKFDWNESTSGAVQKISNSLAELVRVQIENSAKRFGSG